MMNFRQICYGHDRDAAASSSSSSLSHNFAYASSPITAPARFAASSADCVAETSTTQPRGPGVT